MKLTIQIELEGTPVEIDTIKRGLQLVAKLPDGDRTRIFEIIKNPKALKGLRDKWMMLKMMF